MTYKNQSDRWSQDSNGQWWYTFGRVMPWGKRKRTRGIIKKCIVCGDEYLTTPQRLNRTKEFQNPGAYCSKQCVGKVAFKTLRQFGSDHYAWKGGRNKNSKGYIEIYMPDHPFCRGGKYVAEHRLVMEKHLGRYLKPYEKVHHRNCIKDDNRLENLQLVTNETHLGEVECPHCNKTFLIH